MWLERLMPATEVIGKDNYDFSSFSGKIILWFDRHQVELTPFPNLGAEQCPGYECPADDSEVNHFRIHRKWAKCKDNFGTF